MVTVTWESEFDKELYKMRFAIVATGVQLWRKLNPEKQKFSPDGWKFGMIRCVDIGGREWDIIWNFSQRETEKVFILQLKRIITALVHELLRKKTQSKRKTKASQRKERLYISWRFILWTVRFTNEYLVWSGVVTTDCYTGNLQIRSGFFLIPRTKFRSS